MPRKILAPHKEQDGWQYWRVRVTTAKNAANAPACNPLWLIDKVSQRCWKASDVGIAIGYTDDMPGSRIISSRKVERAVENEEFLMLCIEEELVVERNFAGWKVSLESDIEKENVWTENVWWGDTLREAYYRYKAANEQSEQRDSNRSVCWNCTYINTNVDDEPCKSCVEDGYSDDGDWSRPYFRKAVR